MTDSINILKILKTIWLKKVLVLKITAIFVFLGIINAFIAPNEYRVTTTMIPQTESGSGIQQDLGGLASLAGITLGNRSVDEIPPTLYPQIVTAAPFQLDMLKTILTTSKADSPITFEEYQSEYGGTNVLGTIKKYTIGLPGTIYNSLTKKTAEAGSVEVSDSLFRISNQERVLMESLSGILDLSVDEKDGIIALSIVMPEAIAAAQMASNAQKLLQVAITDFKIKKAKEQFEFTNDLYEERKAEFLSHQNALARFRDQHRNISTAVARNELERLEADYLLSQSIYNGIAQQLESMKIKVKENTPSFTVLQPVIVPTERYKPKRKKIVLTALFLGLVVGVGYIFAKQQYIILREEWKSTT